MSRRSKIVENTAVFVKAHWTGHSFSDLELPLTQILMHSIEHWIYQTIQETWLLQSTDKVIVPLPVTFIHLQDHFFSCLSENKCIGDDTKATARQSLKTLKTKKNMAKNDFQYGGWNSYTVKCDTIMTLISPGDCTLQHQVAALCNVIRGSGMTCH